jgi:hypothetical protein
MFEFWAGFCAGFCAQLHRRLRRRIAGASPQRIAAASRPCTKRRGLH